MRYVILLAALAPIGFSASPATATLVLNSTISSSPLMMIPGTTSGPITIFFVDSPDSPVGSMNTTGYQVALDIVPVGATGTLSFNSTVQAATNYIFAAVAHGPFFVDTSPPLSDLYFSDAYTGAYPGGIGGVDVPGGAGFNLADITFTASAGAMGTFNIVALPGLGNSEWTDSSFPTQFDHEFGNVTTITGPVVIGQVQVVPEASAFVAVALVSAVVGAWQLFKRRLV